jgi:hypothetical protein
MLVMETWKALLQETQPKRGEKFGTHKNIKDLYEYKICFN